jgi:DNA-binding transcriptional LysR family regulator
MIELRDLERFLAIVRHRNFGRAAESLGISQPPLSRQIANLEKALGVTLFSRQHRQIELTFAGEVFAREARALLAQARLSEMVTRDAARRSGGRLRIGYPSSARFRLLPAVLRELLASHQEAFVTLAEPSPSQHIERLHAGTLDVAIVRGPHHVDSLRVEVLRSDPLVAVLPDSHPLARKAAVDVRDFEGLPTLEIARHDGLGYHELIRGFYARAGFVPRVVAETESVETLVAGVASGIGVGILHDLSRDLTIAGAVYRPLRPDAPSVQLAAMWRQRDPNPLVEAFIGCLRAATAY